jgi:CheY-like chemotaxis protein
VLVVDDEPMIQSFISRTLRDRHDVTVDDSADNALARLRAGARFDVILCDVMMPQVSGIDFYDAVVVLAPDQAARVLFISAGAFTKQAQQFLENTPRPLIDKPFDPRTLRILVDQMVR